MKLPRSIGLVDLAVITVLLVMVVLPPREMYASAAAKGDDKAQFALALSEARSVADPTNGEKVAELARRLGDANYHDWPIEAASAGATAAKGSPTEWKAQLAASVGYIDRVDVVPALQWANKALATCRALPGGCPSFEEVRMSLYVDHLDAGVKAGIDPRHNPKAFGAAGENAVRTIRLHSGEKERAPTPAPAPAPQQ
jgi:hypothetical protein